MKSAVSERRLWSWTAKVMGASEASDRQRLSTAMVLAVRKRAHGLRLLVQMVVWRVLVCLKPDVFSQLELH